VIVDIHAHFVPQKMLDALASGRASFANVELLREDDSFKLAFAGRAPTRPINPKLRETELRRAWMNENAIDAQVCGGWLDSFGYELPADEGAAWSRFINEHLAEAVANEPFLAPLGSVPLQHGELAAAVLDEAMDAGMKGVMIGTQPHGDSGVLDDPALDPFWQRASDRGAVVFIHPMFGCGDPRLFDFDMMNAVGRGLDTTTAVARLLFSGHFLKYSGMTVILSHGGGALPFMLGRLRRNAEIHPGKYADPEAGFASLYFDSILFDPAALNLLLGQVGAGRVMMGSDYPFPIGDHCPCRVVEQAGLSEIDASAILGGTAARLFELKHA
jgi:aminocarboxymuconate-semialdehyde decarboxylase